MGFPTYPERRARLVLLLDAAIAALVLAGLAVLAFARLGGAASTPPVRQSGVLRPARVSPPAERRVPHGAPATLVAPAIGVRTRLTGLGLNQDGTLEVPTDYAVAGWYELGPKPGQRGAAVIVGHVDSKEGPAVFYRLGELEPGSKVRVAWADGSDVRFRVYAVREYAKTAFPTALVYGRTSAPELRLITCGGPFDASTGHYLDNVVVFARLQARHA
ncbi:MAG TPA: class F sortase [Gaiellaceae bacterium]|nr:class F sortase [Gaiellaceae bacterium]